MARTVNMHIRLEGNDLYGVKVTSTQMRERKEDTNFRTHHIHPGSEFFVLLLNSAQATKNGRCVRSRRKHDSVDIENVTFFWAIVRVFEKGGGIQIGNTRLHERSHDWTQVEGKERERHSKRKSTYLDSIRRP